jgi:23S rRNA (uracil1939-C5)-methyltransferase
VSVRPGARVELAIERLTAGGDGLARLDGRATFVPLTAPGDRVRAELVEVKPRFARARLLEVLEPGPARREVACAYFGRCGGCDWLHIDEAAQRAARAEILRDALVRIGKLDALPEFETLASPRSVGYRARARVACEGGRIGFRARGSREVVDIERCLVLDPGAQSQLEALRARTQRKRPGARSEPQASVVSHAQEVEVRGFGFEAAGLRVSPGSFFQANAALWDAWADRVVELCGRGELVLELYAGVGFYTRRLEQRFARVIAVERDSSAEDLRHNTRARVVASSAEEFVAAGVEGLAPDVALLNPPRTGCDPSVVTALRELAPARIVYVSCDAATLARDVARIGAEYRVARVVVIDALPQTHHVESALLLNRLTLDEVDE